MKLRIIAIFSLLTLSLMSASSALASDAIEIPYGQDVTGVGYIVADGDGANCRVEPGTQHRSIGVIPDGTPVEWQNMLGTFSTWVYVDWQDGCFVHKPLIKGEYLNTEPTSNPEQGEFDQTTYPQDIDPNGEYPHIGSAMIVNTDGDGANCRIGDKVVRALPEGAIVQELQDGLHDGWQLVSTPGTYCFIWSGYLTDVIIPKDSDFYESGVDSGSTDPTTNDSSHQTGVTVVQGPTHGSTESSDALVVTALPSTGTGSSLTH